MRPYEDSRTIADLQTAMQKLQFDVEKLMKGPETYTPEQENSPQNWYALVHILEQENARLRAEIKAAASRTGAEAKTMLGRVYELQASLVCEYEDCEDEVYAIKLCRRHVLTPLLTPLHGAT